jgi:hypothetical protein
MFDERRLINEPGDIGPLVQFSLGLTPKISTAHALCAPRYDTASSVVPIFLPHHRASTRNKGGRTKQGYWMSAAVPSEVSLAASLFEQVSGLTSAPTDGIYADCLISLAFSHLRSGIQKETGETELTGCATAVEGCLWLSTTVRDHVGRTLRSIAGGSMSAALAREIIEGATQRCAHQLVVNCARAAGSDGLESVALAIGDLRDGVRH